MIEGYGKVLADHPKMGEAYTQFMKALEQDLRNQGWWTTTNYSIAPVRGGGSWMSMATVLSGIRMDNQALYTRFISQIQQTPHIPHFLQQQGYYTLTLQPPNRKRRGLPLENHYGYDTSIFFSDLNYNGQHYGWGIIPDQYSLNYTHEQFIKSINQPFFLFFES